MLKHKAGDTVLSQQIYQAAPYFAYTSQLEKMSTDDTRTPMLY